jgi:predicted nucleic acid-binding protein
LVFDSGPLGLLIHPQRTALVVETTEWLSKCLTRGARVLVPAIVNYELRRELLRAMKTFSVSRLDAFIGAAPGRYVPLTDEALRLAAELWAESRQAGRPTAHPLSLDVDVLIAAQVRTLVPSSPDALVVTTNPRHLSRFVPAKLWKDVEA